MSGNHQKILRTIPTSIEESFEPSLYRTQSSLYRGIGAKISR